jgi:hypothetical protein
MFRGRLRGHAPCCGSGAAWITLSGRPRRRCPRSARFGCGHCSSCSVAANGRPLTAHKRQPSDHNSLDLIEAELIAPAIVELRRARRGMVRHRRGLFQRPAVLEIGRDPRRPETVVAEPGRKEASRRTKERAARVAAVDNRRTYILCTLAPEIAVKVRETMSLLLGNRASRIFD